MMFERLPIGTSPAGHCACRWSPTFVFVFIFILIILGRYLKIPLTIAQKYSSLKKYYISTTQKLSHEKGYHNVTPQTNLASFKP